MFRLIGKVIGLAATVIGASTLWEDLGEWVKILGWLRMEITPHLTHDLGRWLVVGLGIFIFLFFQFGPAIKKILNRRDGVKIQGEEQGTTSIAIMLGDSGKPFSRIIRNAKRPDDDEKSGDREDTGDLHTFYFSVKNTSTKQATHIHADITAMTPVPQKFQGRFPVPLLFMNKEPTERSITLNAGSSEPVSVVSYFLDGMMPTLFFIETPLPDLARGFFEEKNPSGEVSQVYEYEVEVTLSEGATGQAKQPCRFKIWTRDEGNSPGQFGMEAISESNETQSAWPDIVDVLIQEGVQLKNSASKFRWYHLHHQEWVKDYLSWRNRLLSSVDQKYGHKKRNFVKAFEVDKPVQPHWPTGGVQNFIVKDVWKLEGELEWLRGEREKLKNRQ